MKSYDEAYSQYGAVFGSTPEVLLQQFRDRLYLQLPVLDVGAGQGRHSLFLARSGFRVVAMDPSRVACDVLQQAASVEHLPLRVECLEFESHAPAGSRYGTVLLFGLIQILSPAQLSGLQQQVRTWLAPGGYALATAFGLQDDAVARLRMEWEEEQPGVFRNSEGMYHHYLGVSGLRNLFPQMECVYQWQGTGNWHHHGDGRLERHHLQEAVLKAD